MNRAFLAFLLVSSGALGAPNCDIRYDLAARWNENPRRFDVTLSFDSEARITTHLRGTANWGGVDNFGEPLRNIEAVNPGASVAADTLPMRWTVRHKAGERIQVRYQILNGVANVDGDSPVDHRDMFRNQLGEKFFSAFGHGMFLVPEEASPPGTVFCINFTQLPAGWSFVSSFGAGQEAGRVSYMTSVSYDVIRHAVFLGGDFRVQRRDIEGRPLYVAIRGDWPFEDGKFVDATATLIGAQRRFFGDFDYPHFLISLVPNRVTQGSSTGGTAVYNAFAMHASKDFTVPGRSFEYLIGHEHLHTWIPVRIGAHGEEADQAARYWFSEGFTDYLTHRLLLATGMWTLEDFAAGMNRVMERYFTSWARSATNARVAKEFWTHREVGQIPYLRGELLAWRWDGALRRKDTTLDGVLKSLVLPRDKLPASDSADPRDYATARLQSAMKALLGAEVERDMAAYVERGDTLPVGAAFLGPCFTRTLESKVPFELGFDSAGIALRRVQGVVAGSAAERAGLRDGMELVGWSIHFGDTAKEVVAQVRDDNGQVRDYTYRPVTAQPIEVPVFTVKPGAAEDAACRAWTGR